MTISDIVDTLKELGFVYVENTVWDYEKGDDIYSLYAISKQVVFNNFKTKIGKTFTFDEMEVHLKNKIRKEKINRIKEKIYDKFKII